MQLTQGLHRSKSLYSRHTATICENRTRTWAEVADRVARLAQGLLSLGIKPGDRVGLLALNSDRYIEVYYAIAWAGCVSVPFNTRWVKTEIDYAIDDSGIAALVVESTFKQYANDLAKNGIRVIAMDAIDDLSSCEQLIQENKPADDHCTSGSDLAAIFYTGGTTGHSKGVMLTHTNLIVNFLGQQAIAPYSTNTIFLHSAPMFHLADACVVFGLTPLGATHVVLPGFEPTVAIDAIAKYRVDALFLVPTMISTLCEVLRKQPADMSNVKRVFYGGSAISEAVLQRAMDAFPNAYFLQGYGQTELSPFATVLVHEDHIEGWLRSVGRPIPTVDIRVVNELLEDVRPGEVGEVVVRGPGVMAGYWNKPELTKATIVGEWLRTGDAGRIDEEGYLYLVDRVKDMIVSGGENIYSAEVENVLLSHPAVLQCAVIGVPDAKWGEAVHAIVLLREGTTATEAELNAHCASLLANYKRPKTFEFRDKPLPLSGAGKILKAEIRKPYWKGHDRHIA